MAWQFGDFWLEANQPGEYWFTFKVGDNDNAWGGVQCFSVQPTSPGGRIDILDTGVELVSITLGGPSGTQFVEHYTYYVNVVNRSPKITRFHIVGGEVI